MLKNIILLLAYWVVGISLVYGCSMYKITIGNKTMVGTNFDAYYLSPRIWFEKATAVWPYGAAFSGGRIDGANGYAPQSGMNQAGLAFSRLAAPTPSNFITQKTNLWPITNPNLYLKNILHQCRSVEEVQQYISKYNHSYFIQDVFIYIEKSGKYLIVEPFTSYLGQDSTYVLSNFCPSVTNDYSKNKLKRYNRGRQLLNLKQDTSLQFCTALADSMHVCRPPLGDGTLLSSIWNLKQGIVNLFFYHHYKTSVQFNLNTELLLADHYYKIDSLFPKNAEFENLRHIATPQTNFTMNLVVNACMAMLTILGLVFFILFFIPTNYRRYKYLNVGIVALNLALLFFLMLLQLNIALFYAKAPYQDYTFSVLSVMAYLPIIFLPIYLYLVYLFWHIVQKACWARHATWLLFVCLCTYLVLISLFIYWGFYNVF